MVRVVAGRGDCALYYIVDLHAGIQKKSDGTLELPISTAHLLPGLKQLFDLTWMLLPMQGVILHRQLG